jgi:phage regulator Rha-like protein
MEQNFNTELLEMVDNEPRISHRVIAEYTNTKQKNIVELIGKYKVKFEEFGHLPFKTESVRNSAGALNEQKTFYLNELQATFLLTLMRNSEIVVTFKSQLVFQFHKMRMQLQKVETQKPEISISETLSKSVEILHLIQLLKEQKTFDLFLLDGILENESPTKLLKIDFSQKYFLPTELGFLKGMSGAEMNLELQKKVFKFVKMKSGF